MINGNVLHIIGIIIIPLLFAITLHEAAHGWIAMKLGDKTALLMGRVTLNPVKHIDPIGTVLVPIVILVLSHFSFAFGWAKPVPVTWQNLRNPRRDKAWVALGGPIANLLMAFFWALIAKLCTFFLDATLAQFVYTMGLFGILINVVLMLLNLIPIPPLDGSRVVSSLLSPRASIQYDRIEPYGIWILLALLVFGVLGKVLLSFVAYFSNLIRMLFGL